MAEASSAVEEKVGREAENSNTVKKNRVKKKKKKKDIFYKIMFGVR